MKLISFVSEIIFGNNFLIQQKINKVLLVLKLIFFYRKNCTSCKCPREAHEVCHEEWVSVRARLGLKGEEPNTSIVFDPREKGFAWTPPGLPAHRVSYYKLFFKKNKMKK